MSKKELFERIKSLEEFLGIAYVPRDTNDDFNEHVISRDFGRAAKIERLIKRSKN